MRNLKKILSLALALMMVLSVMVTASATTFKDDAEIDASYKEAVEVLTGLGIINGVGDAFLPKDYLNREAAAKIVAYILEGSELDANIVDAISNPFSDVSGWSVDVIKYCYANGVVDGVGNGKFLPKDYLTGYAFAKMLLVAAGIDGEYTGANWKLNIATAAKNAGFLEGMEDVALSGRLTREEAAQLAWNAMNYGEKITVTESMYFVIGLSPAFGTAGADVNGKSYSTFSAALAAGQGIQVNSANAVYNTDFTINVAPVTTKTTKDSLGDKVFKLISRTDADIFGRPVTSYYKNNGNTFVATVKATPVATYTTTVSADELYNTLGYNAVLKAEGSAYSTTSKTADKFLKADGTEIISDYTVSNKNIAIGGAGILTEIYYSSRSNIVGQGYTYYYNVVQVRPTLAKVSAVTDVKATATTGAYTQYTVAGQTLKVFTSVVNPVADRTNVTFDGAVAKDDFVLIYGAGTGVNQQYYVAPATLVTGTATGYTSVTDSYTINGTKYPVSKAAINSSDATAPAVSGSSATFALDTYGNVVGSVTLLLPTNYVFVLKAQTANYLVGNRVEPVVEAMVITTDGALQTIQVKCVNESDLDTTTPANQTTGLFSYTIDAKTGRYVLKSETGAAVTGIAKGNSVLGTNVYANNNTVYYVAQKDAEDNYIGVTKYVGFANVPSLTLPTNVKAIDANTDTVAEIVFVDATGLAGATMNYVYLTGAYTFDGSAYTYDVIVKGANETMQLTGANTPLAAGLYRVSDGAATAVTSPVALNIAAGTDGVYADTFFTYSNGLLMTSNTVDGTYAYLAAVGADVPVYTLTNGTCTVGTASELSATKGATVAITVNAEKTAISAIYIVV